MEGNSHNIQGIRKSSSKEKKEDKNVSWGYAHYHKQSDPKFHVEKVKIEEGDLHQKRSSTFIIRKNDLRSMRENLAQTAEATKKIKEITKEQIPSYPTPPIEEIQFSFPSFSVPENGSEDEALIPVIKEEEVVDNPFGYISETFNQSNSSSESTDSKLRTRKATEDNLGRRSKRRGRRLSFHEREFESLDLRNRQAKMKQQSPKAYFSPTFNSKKDNLKKKGTKLIQEFKMEMEIDRKSSLNIAVNLMDNHQEHGINKRSKLMKSETFGDLTGLIDEQNEDYLVLQRSRSQDFGAKTTQKLLSELSGRYNLDHKRYKDEIILVNLMLSRIKVFGDNEVRLDFSEEFDTTFKYFRACQRCTFHLLELLSGSQCTPARFLFSRFREGCGEKPDIVSTAFTLLAILKQFKNHREELQYQDSLESLDQDYLEFTLSKALLQRHPPIDYFWKVLLGSLEFSCLEFKCLCLKEKFQKIDASISTNYFSNVKFSIERVQAGSLALKSASFEWDHRILIPPHAVSILEGLAESSAFKSLFMLEDTRSATLEVIRRISMACIFLNKYRQILDQIKDIWEGSVKFLGIVDGGLCISIQLRSKEIIKIKLFVRLCQEDFSLGADVAELPIEIQSCRALTKLIEESVKMFNKSMYDLESLLSKLISIE